MAKKTAQPKTIAHEYMFPASTVNATLDDIYAELEHVLRDRPIVREAVLRLVSQRAYALFAEAEGELTDALRAYVDDEAIEEGV